MGVDVLIAWWDAYSGFLAWQLFAALFVVGLFWLWRYPLRELFVPLLDELREAVLLALHDYIGNKKDFSQNQRATIVCAALIGGATVTSATLIAAAIIFANISTPVG